MKTYDFDEILNEHGPEVAAAVEERYQILLEEMSLDLMKRNEKLTEALDNLIDAVGRIPVHKLRGGDDLDRLLEAFRKARAVAQEVKSH